MTTHETTKAGEAPASTLASWYTLGVFCVVDLFSYIDSAIVPVMGERLRQDLHLSDVELGLSQGTGPLVMMAVCGFLVGWLADRYNNKLILFGCILLWSTGVIVSATANSFAQLMIGTSLVGAAVSGLTPISWATIPELFHGPARQTANYVLGFCDGIAASASLWICSAMIAHVDEFRAFLPAGLGTLPDWRLTFCVAVLPAPITMLVLGTARFDHRSAHARSTVGVPSAAPALSFVAFFSRNRPALISAILGLSFASFAARAVAAWLPNILQRQFDVSPSETAEILSLLGLFPLVLGFLVSMIALRFLTPWLGRNLPIIVITYTVLICIPIMGLMGFATSEWSLLSGQVVLALTTTLAGMLIPGMIQALAPSHLRGRLTGAYLVVTTLLGACVSPLVGGVADLMDAGPRSLLLASSLVGAPVMALSFALLFWCMRTYSATARDAEQVDATQRALIQERP